jgi:hypothetical protein
VKGFGWVEYKTPFSCHTDASIGTVAHLTAALKQIIHDTRGREPPSEAKLPTTRAAKVGILGTLTPDTLKMKEEGWSSEQLRTQFAQIKADMEVKRAAKDAERHDAHALRQPANAPACDASLIGTHVEVLVRLQEERDIEGGGFEMRYYNQWLPATVVRVSDGSDKKAVAGGGQRKVKPGWFLLAYDDGESIWTRLTEGDFNCARIGSWRLDLDPVLAVGPEAGGDGAQAQVGDSSDGDSAEEEDSDGGDSEEEETGDDEDGSFHSDNDDE